MNPGGKPWISDIYSRIATITYIAGAEYLERNTDCTVAVLSFKMAEGADGTPILAMRCRQPSRRRMIRKVGL